MAEAKKQQKWWVAALCILGLIGIFAAKRYLRSGQSESDARVKAVSAKVGKDLRASSELRQKKLAEDLKKLMEKPAKAAPASP